MSSSELAVIGTDPFNLTPRQIVSELGRYIVGQEDARRAVAIALRNRWRRQRIEPALREEVAPKNILMIGPTGVGKTEIARRLAALAGAPFVKVEATRYTEVGYHGRDVESIIRDLVKASVNMFQAKARKEVEQKAAAAADERILDALLPTPSSWEIAAKTNSDNKEDPPNNTAALHEKTRNKLRKKLADGALDARLIEIDVSATPENVAGIFGPTVGEEMGQELQDALSRMMPKKSKRLKVPVAEARRLLLAEETEKLIDQEAVATQAVNAAENMGIVFIDEIDKVAGQRHTHGPDVSREGVQRDLLPIIEGASVHTRWGLVRTDHILFIAAGAFHFSKPSDLLPELQGRLPIRVELKDLTEEEFNAILVMPQNAITKQYQALLATENVKLSFTDKAISMLAHFAVKANRTSQNIGARRLHTLMEKLLEEVSFEASEMSGKVIKVDDKMVEERLRPILDDEDLAKYIL